MPRRINSVGEAQRSYNGPSPGEAVGARPGGLVDETGTHRLAVESGSLDVVRQRAQAEPQSIVDWFVGYCGPQVVR